MSAHLKNIRSSSTAGNKTNVVLTFLLDITSQIVCQIWWQIVWNILYKSRVDKSLTIVQWPKWFQTGHPAWFLIGLLQFFSSLHVWNSSVLPSLLLSVYWMKITFTFGYFAEFCWSRAFFFQELNSDSERFTLIYFWG